MLSGSDGRCDEVTIQGDDGSSDDDTMYKATMSGQEEVMAEVRMIGLMRGGSSRGTRTMMYDEVVDEEEAGRRSGRCTTYDNTVRMMMYEEVRCHKVT